jgi:hypothetical protein
MGEEAKRVIGKDLLTLDEASRRIAKVRLKQQDWSGLPIPVPGLALVLEPRYKHKCLENFRWQECYDENGVRQEVHDEPIQGPTQFRWINSWWNAKYQVNITVLRDQDGRAQFTFSPVDRLSFTIRTLDAAAAWPFEAEQKALQKLATMVPRDVFELYCLTGHFAEESKRSQVTYLFRKGKPTIAIRQDEEGGYPLCALCLHPIGYYGDTWAGVMCPTDEVIAHLLMMRGSEAKYWANANQHPVDHPAAGV